MPRKHAVAVAALLALAAVTGTVAAVRTTSVGVAAKPAAPDTQLVQRAKRLDAVESSLARALKNQPPALPALRSPSSAGGAASTPTSAPVVATAPAVSAPAPAAPVKVVYRRPAPIVVTVPRSGEGEAEHEQAEHASEATGEDEGGDD